METIQATEAKTNFLRILDRVEQGETVVISRHGKAIARITPETGIDRERVARATGRIRELRKRTGKMTIEEIISAKNEGRR